MPCSENRPKGVSNELWKQYAQINDEIMTLEIEKYIEENFVDVKDIGKIRGLRAQCEVLDDYYNLGEMNDTNL